MKPGRFSKLEARAPNVTRGVTRWLLRESMGVVFVAATLFLFAGRLDWVMGWALVGLYVIWVGANALLLIPRNPELLAERAVRRRGDYAWDTVILGLFGLSMLAKFVVAGLDERFGWTPPLPPLLQGVALVVAFLGYALTTWAMVANTFFSTVVRIQQERRHRVTTGGPYRYVRHPGYVGAMVFELATPVVLGSLWALIPGGLAVPLLIIRTALEDRVLQEKLNGYREYAAQVRYRLIPGGW
ncbi:MAG: isoprenylcysteine carboxylmethyltransferase family protein [Chloroflexaceae bacterium]|nr:isoprenylcysteine carboxylmethyltransferase family protein [Chloroflexaceae bacterium]